MTIDKVHPAHPLNKYLWSRIKAEGIMTETSYSGLVPIIPVEETAEFMTVLDAQTGIQKPPYIVYSWSKLNTGQAWFHKAHNVAYSIRSADDDKMGQLLNLFEREFEDYDRAAMRINQYIASGTSTTHKRYNFTHVNVQVLGAPLPAGSETGVNEALVTLNVNYTQV